MPNTNKKNLFKFTLAALGVVYGDIGTSPLYAIKECFNPMHGLILSVENVLGILSLVFWSLTLVIVFKYLSFILRADNKGEGGIVALLALLIPKLKEDKNNPWSRWIIYLGLFGAALLYGDGVITPSISVLSAIEGLEVATSAFQPVVVPLTIIILICLFASQRSGTATIGSIFGRATLLWFVTLIGIGLPWIIKHPTVLYAMDPRYAVSFFMEHGLKGFLVLGAVVLCITGGEALYADMGHFGKNPIRLGWYLIVFPALLVNYFGQGALILEKGRSALSNPFYGLVEGIWIYPLVAIATVATITASQALISGAFSLTQQAVQLGYFPRMTIRHTSRETEGQIFVPRVNLLLMIACVVLVLEFPASSKLAAAYGIAVTGTMAVTSVLFYFVVRKLWNWSFLKAGVLVSIFLVIDLSFMASNFIKVRDGGWVPLLIAGVIFAIMTTWKTGREAVSATLLSSSVPLEDFIQETVKAHTHRVKGTAVFMTLMRNIAPSTLIHHFKHNQTLHENVILLSILTDNDPEVSASQRVRVTEFSHGFIKVVARYGYMESPSITEILMHCEGAGLVLKTHEISFYLGRETLLPDGPTKIAYWRKKLFIFFSRNARPATEYFKIPPNQVIEIGAQLRI